MKKLTLLVLFILYPYFFVSSQWINQNIGNSRGLNSIFFKNPLTGWVGGDSAAVYKTTNGGINWTMQNGSLFFGNINAFAFPNTSTGWAVGSYQSTGVLGYIYKTTGGGVTWSQQLASSSSILNAACVADTIGQTCWVAGTFGGSSSLILRTTNGGVNWTTQLSGQFNVLHCIYFLNSLTGWAGGEGYVLKTTDGGNIWTPYSVLNNPYSIYFISSSIGWMGANNGGLFKTTNGGVNWTQVLQAGNLSPIYSISFSGALLGYFTYANLIFKTTNAGTSWQPMDGFMPGTLNLLSITCPSATNVFACGNVGMIIRTTNGGGNYSNYSATFYRNNLNKPITMNNVTYDTISVVTDKSPDAVITNISVTIDTVINAVDSGLVFILSHQSVNDTLIFRAGGSGNNFIGTVLKDSASLSINSGSPPFTGSFKPSRPLSQFNYLPYTGLWILKIKESANGFRTGVIKSWNLTITYNNAIGVHKTSEIVPAAYELKQNYPNPFNPTTNIKFLVKETNIITLKVYNILGKEVATLINNELYPGEYEVQFPNAQTANGQIPSGIYFYSMFADNKLIATKKLVMIK